MNLNEFLSEHNIDKQVEFDGQIHRCGKNKNSWFIGFEVINDKNEKIQIVQAGDWSQSDEKYTWCSHNSKDYDYTKDPKVQKQIEEQKLKAKKEKENKQLKAVETARWYLSKKIARQAHQVPYMVSKQITEFYNTFVYKTNKGEGLAIPLMDVEGKVHSLQKIFIDDDGKMQKSFLSGGKTEGCFNPIGNVRESTVIYLTEGWATGVSIHKATGNPVVCAMSTHNIEKIYLAIKDKFPDKEYILCADNDLYNKDGKNPGLIKAKYLKKKYNLPFVLPEFQDKTTKPTDFNDLEVLEGIDIVKALIKNSIEFQDNYYLRVFDGESNLEGFNKPNNASLVGTEVVRASNGNIFYNNKVESWFSYNGQIWVKEHKNSIKKSLISFLDAKFPDGYTESAMSGLYRIILPKLSENIEWNSSKSLVPMKNGLLDIDKKQLRDYEKEDLINWQLPHDYDPEACEMPNIEKLLNNISDGDRNHKKVLLCYLAAVLRGMNNLQKYLEMIGMPGTGKGSYVSLAIELIGKQNVYSTTMKALQDNDHETASLVDKKLLIIPDADSWIGSVEVFKSVTGQDPIRNNPKGIQQLEPFIFEGMCIMSANNPIKFKDSSTAMARRRIPIHMDKFLDENQKDVNLKTKMKAEIPALINKLISFSEGYISDVLNDIQGRREEDNIRSLIETNNVAEWMNERLILEPGAILKCKSLGNEVVDEPLAYEDYKKFVGFGALGYNSFTKSVKEISLKMGLMLEVKKERIGLCVNGARLRSYGLLGDDQIARLFENPF